MINGKIIKVCGMREAENIQDVESIKKICDGLEITVRQFFDSPLFDETEQEIK